jgi:hypothetical protein
MTDAEIPEAKKIKGRSPNYPAISLEEAIVKVRELYKAEMRHPASVSTVLKDWNYRTVNGPAGLALAALKRYGLTDDEGVGTARTIRVSDLAVNILENPNDEAKARAIHTAAFNPPIHRVMWEKFNFPLPSDENIRWFLIQERGFTPSGAKEFIKTYKNTIDYANSFGPVKINAQDSGDEFEDEETNDEKHLEERPKPKKRRMTTDGVDVLTIPLLGGQPPILIEGVNHISEENWNQFMAILNVMKPSLIEPDKDDSEEG